MINSALTHQIEALVDSLRRRDQNSISLSEVAAVTEVLMKTMQLYFRSVDTRIYEEVQSLSDYISNARKEIAALQPENLEGARIPRAGKELDAIVKQTEDATNTIMEAAEEIMSADNSDAQAYQTVVSDACMRIFEACSFQDITGQRISKVVDTLQHIEKRANELRQILDVDAERDGRAPAAETDENKALLSGPALDGEGIDQSEVDQLLAASAPAQAPKLKPRPRTAPPAAAKPAAKAAPQTGQAPASAPKPTAKPVTKNAGKAVHPSVAPATAEVQSYDLPAAPDGRTTQADIDALFN